MDMISPAVLEGRSAAGPAERGEGHPMMQDNQKGAASKAQRKKRLKAEQQLEVVTEPTEYAKSRPRRERQGSGLALGHTSESLELLNCEDFVGPPGSGAPTAERFRVSVNPQVPSIPVRGSAPFPDRQRVKLNMWMPVFYLLE